MIERIDRTGQLDKSHSFDYTTNRKGADCKGQLSIPHVKRLTARVGELLGGQSFLLSSFFIWENFAMTSKVKWITSTIKLSNASSSVGFHYFKEAGLRLPASISCLERHSCPAGRCPNNSSLFPPLAAVVVVALRLQGSGQGTSKKFLPGTSACSM